MHVQQLPHESGEPHVIWITGGGLRLQRDDGISPLTVVLSNVRNVKLIHDAGKGMRKSCEPSNPKLQTLTDL